MKKYINYILCSILFCCPFFALAKVTCNSGNYSATIEVSKSEIGLNDKSNINISSEFEYTVEYKIDTKDIIEINDNGEISPKGVGNAKINTIINFIEEEQSVAECTSILDISVLSNDSKLKLLNLEEIDISAVFNSDKYEYEVKLPYSYEKINIIAEPNDKNAQITGDGRRYLNEGTNEYEIIVKATDGTTTSYKITILRDDANDDATLKNLIVEGYVIEPKFEKDIYEYTLNVDKDVEDININAEATYDLAKILGTGNFKLATGDNTFYITVTAENGSEQEYKLVVNKNKGNSKLNSLEIENYELEPKFNSDKYTYNITVNNNIEKLNIKAESSDNDQIEIIGNEDLQVGENNIIIRVSNEKKGATTYKIVVNKLTLEEQEVIEKNNTLLNILLIIFIVSFVIMIILILIFLKRNYKKSKKTKIKDLKKINKASKKK